MTVLIKNGHVVDPLTKKDGVYDVLVEGKKIQKIAEKIDEKADRVIDARGTYVLPGFIDLHVHLQRSGTGIQGNTGDRRKSGGTRWCDDNLCDAEYETGDRQPGESRSCA